MSGSVDSPEGYKIVSVDLASGESKDFALNKGNKRGPASKLENGGLERPIAVKFTPGGESLYIIDFGIMKVGELGPAPVDNTGVIWKVTRKK
jgi:hypothetical protein